MTSLEPRVERCVRECSLRAWRLAVLLVGCPAEADDVVQQACVVAAQKPEAVPEDDPWPWFAAVVRNVARNARRKRARRARYEDVAMGQEAERVDPDAVDPAQIAALNEFATIARNEVERLPEREREAVVLVHVAGLTIREAAVALAIAPSTAGEAAQRGLARLRQRLGLAGGSVLGAALCMAPERGEGALLSVCLDAARSVAPTVCGVSSGASIGVSVGGFVMKKSVFLACVAAALCVGGLASVELSGAAIGSSTAPDVSEATRLQAALDQQSTELRAATERERTATPQIARLMAETERLQTELGGQATADPGPRSTPDAAPDTTEADHARSASPVIAFGEFSGSAGGVDWKAVAADSRALQVGRAKLASATDAIERREQMMTLMGAGLRVTQALAPFQASGDPDARALQTLPIVVANTIAERLATERLPLDGAQRSAITNLGVAYTNDIAAEKRVGSRHALSIQIGEVARRDVFVTALFGLLRIEQRDVLVAQQDRNWKGSDPFAGVNYADGVRVVRGVDDAAHAQMLREHVLAGIWRLDEEQIEQVAAIVDDWVRAAASHVDESWKVSSPMGGGGYSQRMTTAGYLSSARAQLQAQRRIFSTLVLEETVRARIVGGTTVFLLRRPE